MEGFFMADIIDEAANDNNAARPDFRITYYGAVTTLDLFTEAARQWAGENIEIEPWQWLGKCRLGIDPSIAEEVREALTEAGFNDAEES
jgi:hypothetical protein